MIWTFYDQVVKVEKGWVEQEVVLLIIAALPSEAGLPNEKISYGIQVGIILIFLVILKPRICLIWHKFTHTFF